MVQGPRAAPRSTGKTRPTGDSMDSSRLQGRLLPLVVVLLILAGSAASLALLQHHQGAARSLPDWSGYDPELAGMISRIDESELYRTARDLQDFTTRVHPSAGNEAAAEYLHARLDAIPGLEVGYQGGELRNVVGVLPGQDPDSGQVVVVGAHYDSASSDPARAPGATDNAGGVAIVMELARVMNAHRFNHSVAFAFWNAEETGQQGSRAYVEEASAGSPEIALYFNYDSACYDPEGRFVLDLVYNNESREFADQMEDDNSLYGIGFNLTRNVHGCGSDHRPFWEAGYPAVTTHAETHAPTVHSPGDTADLVSTEYARRNAQLGLLVIARAAGMQR